MSYTVNGVRVFMLAPAGYIVNLSNPPQEGKVLMYWVVILGNILAFCLLCQRLYTKIVLLNKFQVEDGKYQCPSLITRLVWNFTLRLFSHNHHCMGDINRNTRDTHPLVRSESCWGSRIRDASCEIRILVSVCFSTISIPSMSWIRCVSVRLTA